MNICLFPWLPDLNQTNLQGFNFFIFVVRSWCWHTFPLTWTSIVYVQYNIKEFDHLSFQENDIKCNNFIYHKDFCTSLFSFRWWCNVINICNLYCMYKHWKSDKMANLFYIITTCEFLKLVSVVFPFCFGFKDVMVSSFLLPKSHWFTNAGSLQF